MTELRPKMASYTSRDDMFIVESLSSRKPIVEVL